MNFALTLAASHTADGHTADGHTADGHTADGLVADAKTILVFLKGEEK
jgi:hypothetical protein